ncbi:MAG: acyl-CoA synthetase [Bauldia litoralis]
MSGRPDPIRGLADIEALETRRYDHWVEPRSMYDMFRLSAERFGDAPALTYLPSPDPAVAPVGLSYTELFERIRRAANLFASLGVGPDDAVGILLPNIPEGHVALWGASAAGRACPVNYMLRPDHIAELLAKAGAKVLVALGADPDIDIWDRVPDILAGAPGIETVLHVGARPDDGVGSQDFTAALETVSGDRDRFGPVPDRGSPSAYFHTGGTTGAPKLVRHAHGNQLHACWAAGLFFDIGPGDVSVSGFPLFHVAGSIVHGASYHYHGANLVLPTRTGFRNAAFMANFWQWAERLGLTVMCGVPTTMATQLATPVGDADISKLRAVFSGGTSLPTELAVAFEQETGVAVRNGYGMTESGALIALAPFHAPRAGNTVGWRLPFVEVRAVEIGADGESFERDCGPGETGVLVIRGPNVASGYTDPARNVGVFRDDGWLISGDLGFLDDAGLIHITGRAKDVIVRGAHNIDPAVIEEIAAEHPAVALCAAVGEPDAYAGEVPLLFVTLKAGASLTEDEMLDFLAGRIHERPALPKGVVVLDAMPATGVGKIYKPALRALAVGRRIGAVLAPLAASGVAIRVEGLEESGVITSRIHVEGAADKDKFESEINALLRDFAVAREVVWG